MSPRKTDKVQEDLNAVLDKITSMPEPYSTIGARLHETILSAGPRLRPRIWYGMPGYATGRSTPVRVFFRLDDDVMTFGLTEKAHVAQEPGSTLRPCAWYLEEIDDATLEKIAGIARTAFAQ